MRLGGGTVLGAQWHHRLSFDIDITVDETTPRGDLTPRPPQGARSARFGGTRMPQEGRRGAR